MPVNIQATEILLLNISGDYDFLTLAASNYWDHFPRFSLSAGFGIQPDQFLSVSVPLVKLS